MSSPAKGKEIPSSGVQGSRHVRSIGPVEAELRWQIGVKMGGTFLDPISLARCEWTAQKAQAA